jgi:hypothetical protein
MVASHLRKIRNTSIRKSNAQITPREFRPNHRRPIKRPRTTTTKKSDYITRAEGLGDHESKATVGTRPISSRNGSSDPDDIFESVEGDPPTEDVNADEDDVQTFVGRHSSKPNEVSESVEDDPRTEEVDADEDDA